ncbi:hypothetical protein FLJU110815_20470 [Flavobacterium jumunjinense]
MQFPTIKKQVVHGIQEFRVVFLENTCDFFYFQKQSVTVFVILLI